MRNHSADSLFRTCAFLLITCSEKTCKHDSRASAQTPASLNITQYFPWKKAFLFPVFIFNLQILLDIGIFWVCSYVFIWLFLILGWWGRKCYLNEVIAMQNFLFRLLLYNRNVDDALANGSAKGLLSKELRLNCPKNMPQKRNCNKDICSCNCLIFNSKKVPSHFSGLYLQ